MVAEEGFPLADGLFQARHDDANMVNDHKTPIGPAPALAGRRFRSRRGGLPGSLGTRHRFRLMRTLSARRSSVRRLARLRSEAMVSTIQPLSETIF